MIAPHFRIRDCRIEDMELIRYLFASEGFDTLEDPSNIRVAVTADNTMYGACRLEQGSDGHWNVRPVVVFDVVQGMGVGSALIKDALKRQPELYLVSRGSVEPFYLANGFEECSWDEIAPEYVTECHECPGHAECNPHAYKSKPIQRTLTFLGTSSGCGVPSFFCHCPSCDAARKDPSLRRGCTGVVLRGHGTTLIDTPPDVRHQLVRENVDMIDEVFLTHAHYDHLGGFGELEYFVRLYLDGKLPFHASEYALEEAFKEFFYMDDCFGQDAIKPYDTRVADGMTIQALPLNHCPGCYGYLITTPQGRRTFYAPDTAALYPQVIEILQGVDNLIMDSTFWANCGEHRTHHMVRETIDEGLNLLGAGHVYLTHLAPHMCDDGVDEIAEIYKYAAQFDGRVTVAEDGMVVEL